MRVISTGKFLAVCAAIAIIGGAVLPVPDARAETRYERFVRTFWASAKKAGVSRKTYDKAFAGSPVETPLDSSEHIYYRYVVKTGQPASELIAGLEREGGRPARRSADSCVLQVSTNYRNCGTCYGET